MSENVYDHQSVVGTITIKTAYHLPCSYSSLNMDSSVKDLAAEDLIDLIYSRNSHLQRRYAYLIMRQEMYVHTASLRDGDGKLFWEELDGHPHWLGIPIIIDDNAAEPLYLVSMPLVLLPARLEYPRKEDGE